MKRVAVVLAAVISFVPAVLGVWGNESFSEDVPVVLPAPSVQIVAETELPTAHPTTSTQATSDEGDDSGETPASSAGETTPTHHPTSPEGGGGARPTHKPSGEHSESGSSGSSTSDEGEGSSSTKTTEAESPEH